MEATLTVQVLALCLVCCALAVAAQAGHTSHDVPWHDRDTVAATQQSMLLSLTATYS